MDKNKNATQDYQVVIALTTGEYKYRDHYFNVKSESKTTYHFDTEDDAFDFLLGHIRDFDFFAGWFDEGDVFGYWACDEMNSMTIYIRKWEGFNEKFKVEITDQEGNLIANDIGEVMAKYNAYFDDDWYRAHYIFVDKEDVAASRTVFHLQITYNGKSLFYREPIPEEATSGLFGRWNEELGGPEKSAWDEITSDDDAEMPFD